jgi:hypothetical protein
LPKQGGAGRTTTSDITDVRYTAAQVWRDGEEPWTVELIAPEDEAR